MGDDCNGEPALSGPHEYARRGHPLQCCYKKSDCGQCEKRKARRQARARSFRARWLLLHRGQAWQSEGRAAFTGKALLVNYSVVGSGVHTVMRLAAASSGDRIGQLADLNGAPSAFPDSAAAHNRTLPRGWYSPSVINDVA